MNAKQAKQIADSINEKKAERQRMNLYVQIEEAAKEGRFELYFYENIFPPVKKALKDDGYAIVEHSDQRDGLCIKISW
jgi:hypothetical protein